MTPHTHQTQHPHHAQHPTKKTPNNGAGSGEPTRIHQQKSAGGGIRTLGSLSYRILSPAPLTTREPPPNQPNNTRTLKPFPVHPTT